MTLFKTDPNDFAEIIEIAHAMLAGGLERSFVSKAVALANEYEGALDLFRLWKNNTEQTERDEVIADLQEQIEEEEQSPTPEKPRVSYKEIEGIAQKVLAHKKELRKKVDQWGGITKLAQQIGMPQPSLSRFFNSASLPRKTTLYKIANALNLPESEVVTEWAK